MSYSAESVKGVVELSPKQSSRGGTRSKHSPEPVDIGYSTTWVALGFHEVAFWITLNFPPVTFPT